MTLGLLCRPSSPLFQKVFFGTEKHWRRRLGGRRRRGAVFLIRRLSQCFFTPFFTPFPSFPPLIITLFAFPLLKRKGGGVWGEARRDGPLCVFLVIAVFPASFALLLTITHLTRLTELLLPVLPFFLDISPSPSFSASTLVSLCVRFRLS